jgi:hypothetical protein
VIVSFDFCLRKVLEPESRNVETSVTLVDDVGRDLGFSGSAVVAAVVCSFSLREPSKVVVEGVGGVEVIVATGSGGSSVSTTLSKGLILGLTFRLSVVAVDVERSEALDGVRLPTGVTEPNRASGVFGDLLILGLFVVGDTEEVVEEAEAVDIRRGRFGLFSGGVGGTGISSRTLV